MSKDIEFYKKGTQFEFLSPLSKLFGYYKTVAAVFALIDYAGLFVVRVYKAEELMLQEVHLHNSLLDRHRLKGEGFDSYIEVKLLLGIRVLGIGAERILSYTLFEARFVLSYLPFQSLYRAVKRVCEGGVLLFTAEKHSVI